MSLHVKEYHFKGFALRPERLLLIFSMIIGVLFSVFIPYGAGIDEEMNAIRIFDISGLHLLPNRSLEESNYTFSEFKTLSYQRGSIQTPATSQFSESTFLTRPNWNKMDDGHTTATYPPLMYLVQALIAGICWRLFNFPIIPVVIAMRIVGLTFYIFACWLTIRLLPFGKWVFLVLALALTPLYQAATLNGDGYTNAACFLFTGVVLNAYAKKDKPISIRDSLKIAAVALLVGFAKSGQILILFLLLLLIKHRFSSAKARWVLLTGVLLSIAISLGWSALAVLDTTTFLTKRTRIDQILLVFNNLGNFLQIYFKNLLRSFGTYYRDWAGIYAYWGNQVPVFYYFLFPATLLCGFLAEPGKNIFSTRIRLSVSLLAIILILIIASVTIVFRYSPGQERFEAQGRYMVAFAPLLFLAWAGIAPVTGKIDRIATGLTLALLVALTSIYTIGAYRTFYNPCMNNYSPCLLPIYRDIQLDSPGLVELDAQTVVSQSFTPECSRIKSVEVHKPQSINASGEISLELLDGSGSTLRSVKLPLDSVQDQTTLALVFPELSVEVEKTYRFELRFFEQVNSAEKFKLIASDGNEYSAGELLVNGLPLPTLTDLYFQYECVR
jgi:uncharacterized membrane protein